MKKYFILFILTIFLIGCGVATDTVTDEEPAAESGAALTAVTPTSEAPSATSDLADIELDTNQPEPDTPEIEQLPITEPEEVDLGQITPKPVEGETPVIQPPPSMPQAIDDELADLIQRTRADLSGHLNIAESEVQLLEWRNGTWRDGSMGCPQPGMMYTMSLIPGYQLIFEAQGEKYYYHTRKANDFILCESDQRQDFIAPDS